MIKVYCTFLQKGVQERESFILFLSLITATAETAHQRILHYFMLLSNTDPALHLH